MPRTARTVVPSSSRNSLTIGICIAVLFSLLLVSKLFLPMLAAGESSSLTQMTPPIHGLRLSDLRDTFAEVHSGHPHEAIDIVASRGTPVHAVVSGTIRKLFLSKPGGNTVYEFDDAGVYCYYYAHLDGYTKELREGMHVERGSVIAFVGLTGNADPRTPHLHFAVFQLGPEKTWWKGTAVNPYPALVDAVRRERSQ